MNEHRYITPENVMKHRFVQHSRPTWKIAVICFRDYKGSQVLVNEFGAKPLGYKALYGMEEFDGVPIVYEAEVGGERVGIVTRCNWGGPQAAILVEELASLGVTHLIGYGAAGSLDERLGKGSQVVCGQALAADGTSRAYAPGQSVVYGDEPLLRWAEEAGLIGKPVTDACAANVDALYRETKPLMESLRVQGANIVNMETAALYAASAVCGVKSVWIGFISDCLVSDEWDDWHVNLTELAADTSRIVLGVVRSAVAYAGAERERTG